MSSQKKNVVLAAAIAAAVAAPAAFATNGYFAHGYSMKEQGLAGAGVALSQDSLAAATNPAGMVMVGSRMDVGVALFSPRRSYSVNSLSGGFFQAVETVDSDNELFIIPHFGYNKMLDANSSFGVAVYGNGGMNTEYPANANNNCGTFNACAVPGPQSAGVDLMQLFITPTYSRKFSDKSSWGASAIIAYQRFKAHGLAAFGGSSTDPVNLTDKGYDNSTGFGFKLGVQSEVSPGVTLGASYQSKTKMGEFDNYKGLFAEKGDFDIPATWTVGVAANAGAGKVVFDVQKILYGQIAAINNKMAGSGPLGADNGMGFGWQDMTIYKLGYQWQAGSGMTYRVGYSQGDQPIPNTETMFNILAPGVVEKHVTFGLTKETGKGSEFTFAAMYAPEKEVTGTTPYGDNVTLRMDQWQLGASWGWKF